MRTDFIKPTKNGYVAVSEAAEIMNVSPSTVWRWIESGLLPAYRFGRRRILIEREALNTVIKPAHPTVRKSGPNRLAEQSERINAFAYPMSASAHPNQKALVEDLRSFQKRMLAHHGGKVLPGSSADLIRAAREERDL